MKKLIFVLWIAAFPVRGMAQSDSVDVNAVVLLDRMSEVIGEMASCSFGLQTSVDKPHPTLGLLKEYATHQVHAVGPDKLHVQTKGANSNHSYWYNGDILMYYSLTYNHYGFIETPDNILETIEFVHSGFGIEFPAADFFYPTFADDLLEHSDYVKYLGLVNIDGVECHHIAANGPEQTVQLWISNDTFTLPLRYVVIQKTGEQPLHFEGVFSEWRVNPDLPQAIFDFTAPQSARRISLVPRNK
jgi:hypothetical protein